MSHINHNHLCYFWHVYEESSVVSAVETLYLAPQTIAGQIRALEGRLQGKLFRRRGRDLEPSGLGELAHRYANKMLILSQETLDIVSYRKESNLLLDVGVAGTLPERLVSNVLDAIVVEDEQIHLCCFRSTHEILLGQLSQHKLDMTISDRPIDPTRQEGLFSMKIGEHGVSLWYTNPLPERPFPVCLEERRLPIPGCCSMLGRKLLSWFNSQGLNVEISGEFNDAALMEVFGMTHNAIFVVPSLYANDSRSNDSAMEIDRVEDVMEEYHAIFVERMIQRPAIQRICSTDYSTLFTPASR